LNKEKEMTNPSRTNSDIRAEIKRLEKLVAGIMSEIVTLTKNRRELRNKASAAADAAIKTRLLNEAEVLSGQIKDKFRDKEEYERTISSLKTELNDISNSPENGELSGNQKSQAETNPDYTSSLVNPVYPELQHAVNPFDAPLIKSTETQESELPQILRLDGQPLQKAENLYPELAYDENVHQPWSTQQKQQAEGLYPGFAKRLAAIPPRQPDSPDDLMDPDYYPLPDNPTFRDAWYHGRWKKKKAGGF
jgi:hypothetical protein